MQSNDKINSSQGPTSPANGKKGSGGTIIIAANGSHLSAKELKATLSFRKILERDRHQVERRGKSYACLCPFHDEKTPSFFIWEDDKGGKCYGCGWHGDLYTYEMDYHDIDFSDALKRLQKRYKTLAATSVQPGKRKAAEPCLTPEQHKILQEASQRLSGDDWLCGRVADPRGWKRETIKSLAAEGSLGWNQGAFAFIYTTGLKLRNWPHREFVWEFGHGSLWRSHRLKDCNTIYLTEGETDAISLIDIGIEEPGTCVVALPSATTIPSDLAQALTGKDVILCMDNDEAGEKATSRLVEILEPVCASVKAIDWKEVA